MLINILETKRMSINYIVDIERFTYIEETTINYSYKVSQQKNSKLSLHWSP